MKNRNIVIDKLLILITLQGRKCCYTYILYAIAKEETWQGRTRGRVRCEWEAPQYRLAAFVHIHLHVHIHTSWIIWQPCCQRCYLAFFFSISNRDWPNKTGSTVCCSFRRIIVLNCSPCSAHCDQPLAISVTLYIRVFLKQYSLASGKPETSGENDGSRSSGGEEVHFIAPFQQGCRIKIEYSPKGK